MDLEQIEIGSVQELIERMALEAPRKAYKRDTELPATSVPDVVRKLRVARLKRRMRRQEVLGRTRRSGATHWKARKAKRKAERKKAWKRRSKQKHRKARMNDPARRYKEIYRTQWKRKLKNQPHLLAECMTQEEYVRLMEYVPDRVFELAEDVTLDTKYRNLASKVADGSWVTTSYPNSQGSRVMDVYHMILRLDTSKSYSLQNVIVVDYYSRLVYYSCTMI
jgi:hypothetical protein